MPDDARLDLSTHSDQDLKDQLELAEFNRSEAWMKLLAEMKIAVEIKRELARRSNLKYGRKFKRRL